MQKVTLFKVRNFGEIFNDTFSFIRQNLWPLVRPSIIIAGPLFFLSGLFLGSGMGQYYKTALGSVGEDVTDFGAMDSFSMDMVVSYGIGYFFIIVGYVLFIAIINSYIILYRGSGNGTYEITTTMVWQEAKKHLGWLMFTFIVVSFLIGIGFIFCLIPGIFLSVPLSLIFILRMEERKLSLGEALKKCFKLTENYWWLTFGIILLLSLIYSLVGSTISLPVSFLLMGSAFLDAGLIDTVAQSLLMGITHLFTFLLSGILYVGIAITYYSHRERMEGISLANKIDSLGGDLIN